MLLPNQLKKVSLPHPLLERKIMHVLVNLYGCCNLMSNMNTIVKTGLMSNMDAVVLTGLMSNMDAIVLAGLRSYWSSVMAKI